MEAGSTVLVTGGAGYIGCVLVPKLAKRYRVVILDACWFGKEALLSATAGLDNVTLIEGDIRDTPTVRGVLTEYRPSAVIHLAAVSNDPCSEIDPELTRSINLEATSEVMRLANEHGVRRFLNASSASVYGIKETADVTEDLSLEPLTLYARYKTETEKVLGELIDETFCGASVRAATVCGFSPRLRLDLTINILTYHALRRGAIRVFGGTQMRPNIHVQDLTDFYALLLELPDEAIRGKAFNVVTSNATVMELAEMIRDNIDAQLPINVVPTEDTRSYHLSGAKARAELEFEPQRPLDLAIRELREAFDQGTIADPDSIEHRNVEVMKQFPERTAVRRRSPSR